MGDGCYHTGLQDRVLATFGLTSALPLPELAEGDVRVFTLRVTAVPAIHRRLLDLCQPVSLSSAAQRKARREYANRVTAHEATA
jgi:hypothetical protein